MQELPYTRTYLLFFNLSVRIKALSNINLNMTLISAKNSIPVNFQCEFPVNAKGNWCIFALLCEAISYLP